MKDKLVTMNTALLAEKKGYKLYKWFNYIEWVTNLPSQSLLQKWLREEHSIKISINPYASIWMYRIRHNNDMDDIQGKVFNTYEKSLEKGLQEGLKLI